jgi:hypothetical protein
MSSIVTDQFRVNNSENFINSILNDENSYYIFLGLSNPGSVGNDVGFGRTTTWDDNPSNPLIPVDNLNYLSHYKDTSLFGKKITSDNVRRVVRRVDWTPNTRYDMYRHDYDTNNLSPVSNKARLYSCNYYVLTSDFRVYICIENGSSGSNPLGNPSVDEPNFIKFEPSEAGSSGDGYIWKYLYSISPSEVIKFDSIEYIPIPSNWSSSSDPQIQSIREYGNSDLNNNQIKTVYIENGGAGYTTGEYNIIGDGQGAKVYITVNSSGSIITTRVTSGGSGYTYGIVDLGSSGTVQNPAKLIPIIPPSRGHGYNIYEELGADKVLLYARFDDSTKSFPVDTNFCQIGVIKNPKKYNSSEIYKENNYSSLNAIKINTVNSIPNIGDTITQNIPGIGTARGYVASFDNETKVIKYYQDRSLYFANNVDQTDRNDVSILGKYIKFQSDGGTINPVGSIDVNFSGISTTVNNKKINLDVSFTNGLSNPEINKGTGEVIYIDNRSLVSRNSRQKEDVKIILEF